VPDSPIGFVGLGKIGANIATRAAQSAGVVAYDVVPPAGGLPGVTVVGSLGEVARSAQTVLLSLPNADASRAVVRELVETAGSHVTLVVELSTIGPRPVDACALLAAEHGVGYVDAPVSGGIEPALRGTLSVMASGDPASVERALPVLETIATKVFVMGDKPGLGQVMKLANNIIGHTALAVTSEAAVFGTHHGLDLARMIDVINVSTGRTEASAVKFPKSVLTGTYQHGARGEIVAKDVALYLEEAAQSGVPTFVAAATVGLWRQFVDDNPEADFTYIHKYLEDMLG
jgi:3-hydroxyisobutyrate dehydrogenase-like beta-hydroxyacid dehydrogenase